MTESLGTLDLGRLVDVPRFGDSRGQLFPFQRMQPVPFVPVRAFIIAEVPEGKHRAQHLLSCEQFLWMVAGSCHAMVRDGPLGGDERHFRLSERGPGLYLPKGVWLDLSEFAPASILLCLAAADYVPR